jgi:hypothetical protein
MPGNFRKLQETKAVLDVVVSRHSQGELGSDGGFVGEFHEDCEGNVGRTDNEVEFK